MVGFVLNYRFKRLKLGKGIAVLTDLLINLGSGGSVGFVVGGKVVNCGGLELLGIFFKNKK